jgi:arginyl-tRNA synthetase
MNIFKIIQNEIKAVIVDLQKHGHLMDGLDLRQVTAQPPRNPKHSDVASNVAMVLSKQAFKKPMELAELVGLQLKERVAWIDRLTVVEPGFINIKLSNDFWCFMMGAIANGQKPYLENIAGAEKILVEFVSANPTGPLHVGHTRGAIVGDVLCNILSATGYKISREYYINDMGNQMQILRDSVAAVLNKRPIPEGGYNGGYIKDIARSNREPEEYMLENIRSDLSDLGVKFDKFVREFDIISRTSNLPTSLEILRKKGLVYDDIDTGAVMFRSTRFGDDKDRVVQRGDGGSNTYFATDIAYHLNKIHRGYTNMINIFGADHDGYTKRLSSAVNALDDKAEINFIMVQLVRLMKDGKPFKMSKRKADYVTLRDVLDEIGADAIRYMMLMQTHNKGMDFDMDVAMAQTKDNPLWYVQYAHTRTCSVLEKAKENKLDMSLYTTNLIGSIIFNEYEVELLQKLSQWQYIMEGAALSREPHKLAIYLYDLASVFHKLWNSGNSFIDVDAPYQTILRLEVVRATQRILDAGLRIMGIAPLTKM